MTGSSSPPEERRGLARASALVAAGILTSRLLGFLRQRAVAHVFGTSAWGDVLAAAFRIGNVAQNLLGEGTLSASFVPIYGKLVGAGERGEATRFARVTLGALLLVVAAVSIAGVVLARPLALLVAGGLPAADVERTAALVRLVVPMTATLVVGAWALGVLTTHRSFFLPYAAPSLWSLAQIAGLWALSSRSDDLGWLAQGLALSALAGAVLQVLVLLPAARARLGRIAPLLALGDARLREAAARLPAVLAGRGVMQLSGLVDSLLVSFAGGGAVAALGYAQTLYLLPMSVLGTGEAAALLPEVAREAGRGGDAARDAKLRELVTGSLRRVAVLGVPVAVALSLFGGEIVGLLLHTGRFDAGATALVVPLLAAYGGALLANAFGRVLASGLLALGDTKAPARFAVARVAWSTAVALALLPPLGALGVVVGAASAGWLEMLLLARALRARAGASGLGALPFARLAALGVVVAAAGLGARRATEGLLASVPLRSLAVLSSFGVAFVAAVVGLRLLPLGALLRRRRAPRA